MSTNDYVEQHDSIPLWSAGAPGATGQATHDIPSLTPYLPASTIRTNAAIVICPGGGYEHLAPHEGHDYALWLTLRGVTCFVLQYRLGSSGYRHPAMLMDVTRAVRLVRAHAAEWQLDPNRIGVMGSSAGGHLAATLLTHFDEGQADAADSIDRASSRPDLGVLCYPVISMGPLTHAGSKQNLLGENPDADLVHLLSNEHHVTPQTPPCFMWHTWEDDAVKVENSLEFAAALRRNNVPFDLHVYQQGEHGLGLGDSPPFLHAHVWANDLEIWLRVQGFVRRSEQ